MNQFKVNPARGDEFEDGWRRRESSLGKFAGFVQFALLKGDEPGDYISHTTWSSREAFVAWTQSDAFRQAHAGSMPDGVIEGHPRARFYESVIVESGAARPAGG